MKLLTLELRRKLLANGRKTLIAQEEGRAEPDLFPVVKLFTPDANATWLLTELDPEAPDIAFGLCDLGLGHPELGSVAISEIESIRGPLGLPVERDLHFKASARLSRYADEARKSCRIKA